MIMQINITKFYNEAAPINYSASVAEIGANAGPDTWNAAKDDAMDWNMLDTDEKRQAFRDWVKQSGGWSQEEIGAWGDVEINALFVQWVSGDIREMEGLDIEDWQGYYNAGNGGLVSCNLWEQDGEVWFSLEM